MLTLYHIFVYVAKALVSKDKSRPTVKYWVKKYEEAEGDIIENAFPSQDQTGGWEVSMEFTDAGGEEFARITQEIADENARTNSIGQLAIVLDGKLESAKREFELKLPHEPEDTWEDKKKEVEKIQHLY